MSGSGEVIVKCRAESFWNQWCCFCCASSKSVVDDIHDPGRANLFDGVCLSRAFTNAFVAEANYLLYPVRLLLIEDSVPVGKGYQFYFKKHFPSTSITWAKTAEEADRCLAGEGYKEFDIIVSDHELGGARTGAEVVASHAARALETDHKVFPLVVFSSAVPNDCCGKITELGAAVDCFPVMGKVANGCYEAIVNSAKPHPELALPRELEKVTQSSGGYLGISPSVKE